MVRVIHPFHDKYSPEKIFYPGEYVIVEDAERLKDILERGLATEEEPEDPNAIVKTLERHVEEAKGQGAEAGEDDETATTEDAKEPEQGAETDKDEEVEAPSEPGEKATDEELLEEVEKEEKSTKRGKKK